MQGSNFQNFNEGDIALISRGYLLDCNMTVKIMNAINSKASGVLVYYDPGNHFHMWTFMISNKGTTGLFSSGLSSMASIPCFAIT